MDYASFYRRAVDEPEAFWAEQAGLIDWQQPFTTVCEHDKPPFANWFVGGKTNLCHNAVDRHAAAHPQRNALIWVATEVDKEIVYSYAELQREVARSTRGPSTTFRSFGGPSGSNSALPTPLAIARWSTTQGGCRVHAGSPGRA